MYRTLSQHGRTKRWAAEPACHDITSPINSSLSDREDSLWRHYQAYPRSQPQPGWWETSLALLYQLRDWERWAGAGSSTLRKSAHITGPRPPILALLCQLHPSNIEGSIARASKVWESQSQHQLLEYWRSGWIDDRACDVWRRTAASSKSAHALRNPH